MDINAIAGVTFEGEPARIGMIEARAAATPHVSLAAAVAYFEGAAGYDETQLRLNATFAGSFGAWTIENRHLLSLSTESVERYRCRVRIVRPNLLSHPRLSARAFDELFVDFDGTRVIRNNAALGVGLQLRSTLSAEVYHVWVDNRDAPNDTYMLAMLTVRLGSSR